MLPFWLWCCGDVTILAVVLWGVTILAVHGVVGILITILAVVLCGMSIEHFKKLSLNQVSPKFYTISQH